MRSNLLQAALAVLLLALATPAASSNTDPAPDFALADLAGQVTKLSDLRGSVVVLNFWATWCPECVIEMPSLRAFTDQYRTKDVTVLTVSIDRSEKDLRTFLEEHPVPFPVLRDPSGDVFVTKYRTRALPATVVIDREGGIAARLYGRQDFQARGFTKRIEELLERSK